MLPASACSECLFSDYLTVNVRGNVVLLMPVDFVAVALLPKLRDVSCCFGILNVCIAECCKLLLTVNVLFLPRGID